MSSLRQCAYCGKPIAKNVGRCPHCREVVPQVEIAPEVAAPAAKRSQILRGFIYMLLGVVVHYLLERSSTMNLPFTVPAITLYFTPMLFLGGLALTLYGFISRVTA